MQLIRQLEFWLVTLFLVVTAVAEYYHAEERYREIFANQWAIVNGHEFEQYLASVDWLRNDFGSRMLPLLGLYVAWLLVHFAVDFRRKAWFRDGRFWLVMLVALGVLAGGVWGHQTGFRSGHLVEKPVVPQPNWADSLARIQPNSTLAAERSDRGKQATEKPIVVISDADYPRRPLSDLLILLFVLAGYEALAQVVYAGYGALLRSGTLARWRIPVETVVIGLVWGVAVLVLVVSGLLRPQHEPIRLLLLVGFPVWYAGLLSLRYGLLTKFGEKLGPSLFLFGLLLAPALSTVGTGIAAAVLGLFDPGVIFLLLWAISVLAVFPSAVYLFRQDRQTRELQTDLGQTGAELAGLKAQLNPHFLFNALNTLYASALQEGGERTAEGIQRLGDLMRFMLHDNAQDFIDLSREVEYLRQYVELQRLRIGAAETVDIRLNLPETTCPNQVPPMLLIPFVENAFKHGISLRQPSWIDVELTCEPGRVVFRVSNSKHVRTGDQPEAEASGIGLENVRKRLDLLYPNRHTLTIHETSREFSVGLELEIK